MEMFRFGSPGYLYALLLIPALVALFIYFRIQRNKALREFGNPEILAPLMPGASGSRPIWKFAIVMLALAFLITGLARPQFGAKLQKINRKGIELIIALDVSNSMLAEDIQPNRLEKAKMAISRLTERLSNDKIGLVVFAGKAYTQIPITTDYASTKMFLNAINTEVVPVQGTAIGDAINLAMSSFTPSEETSKAIIVITDGENHEDDAIEMAKQAAEAKITVHTIGMGLPQGGPIPIYNAYGQKDFKRDKSGQVVVTRLDENMLEQIAAAGNGKYIRANNTEIGINNIFDEINKMEKSELESRIYSDYNDQFFYFIVVAFALLLIEFFVLERKNNLFKNILQLIRGKEEK
ncbi:MAG TPA: VWA domain-containing protein [Prolixibacteraceae bacterium]|nr:VWA domain-containing protein [Prolixibacteraceae bacterium]HUM88519.1 VWA domain-containing protein [Prolixibacteraceae bacterium]